MILYIKNLNSEKLYIYRKINNTYVLVGQSQKWW